MEREQISALLEKYWNGETSLEEERIIKEYFSNNEVPEEWHEEAGFFRFLNHQQERVSLKDEEILMHLNAVEPKKSLKPTIVSLWIRNAGKVAAVITILAVAVIFIREDYILKKDQMDPVLSDTFEDPQKAFEETKKALMLVSQQFGKGRKHAQKIKVLDEAAEKVQEL